jgi:hypothetical protein
MAETLALYYAKVLLVHPFEHTITTHLGGVWRQPPSVIFGPLKLMVAGIFVAPLAETFLHQWLIFSLAARTGLLPRRLGLTIIVSAVLFGAAHFYSAGYILSATCTGFILAAAFWAYGQNWRAYWMLVATHATINAVASSINLWHRARG